MAVNPNWPNVEHAWGPLWTANGGAIPADHMVNVVRRTMKAVGVQRGRQYELDQVQAGTLSATLSNTDGFLDPSNSAGPWYGNISPFQPLRIRMQYPPTANLLAQGIATGTDGTYVFSTTDPSQGASVGSASAFEGGTVFQFNVPSATMPGPGSLICYTNTASVIPGAQYTMQMQIRNTYLNTSVQVWPFIGWYGSTPGMGMSTFATGATYTLTGAHFGAWTQAWATATAPIGACGMVVGLMAASTPGASVNIQVDGWQLELGATPSTFTVPGITYPLYAGFVERWPSAWTEGGSYGVVQPTGVDAFALLSQRLLRAPLTEEIYRRSPRFLYALDDPQNVTAFADSTGNNPAAPIGVSTYGAGSLTSGNKIAATSPSGIYTGSTGSVVSIANANPGSNVIGAANFISLSSIGIKGPATPSSFTRMIAFRYTGPTPTAAAQMWSCMDGKPGGSGSRIDLYLFTNGEPVFHIEGPTGQATTVYFDGATNCADGNWHLLIFGLNASNGTAMASQDGAVAQTFITSGNVTPTGLISDNVGAFVDPAVGHGTAYNFQGDISYVCEWPGLFSDADITAVYTAWRNAFAGDSTDQRYARILGWAGYTGATNIQTGLTTAMGPAQVDGQDALSALEEVTATENGAHFVDRSGAVVFKSRSDRYNSTTATYVFGERADLGEFPYEELTLDYDSTHLANLVTVTQPSTSQTFTASDLYSQQVYFPRTMTRTVNSASPFECQDAANYLLSRYHNPLSRVTGVKLHPSAHPALWPACLAMELGTRIRIMRRPFGAPPIQLDAFVEHLDWQFDDQGEAWLTLQCSPVDKTPYGLFGAWRSAIYGATQPVGTWGFPVAPMRGDNSQQLAAIIGHGQQVVIEPGTPNAETFTVDHIGATTPGSWSYGVIVMTAPSAIAHPVGAVICEALPGSVTDPTAWDSADHFDSSAFAY
ncbi:hypothetical protein P3T36_002989 [Kitasatospora sp. MAP12-15]|uniref:hypothetical protein n=1 Tax=unclassified Kitasatospora TaxID=2633591 RepID=UPI002476BB1D|nr:hypothetical protein [Kitasatospora sp. MAP12-44]MDH6108858.1 hypothetical protein [Kitasatospora sp. MAP12-44]